MNKILILKPNKEEKPTSYEVFYTENNFIGNFDMLGDGFFYFHPNTKYFGYFNEYDLELICNELKELNGSWQEMDLENPNILTNYNPEDLPF